MKNNRNAPYSDDLDFREERLAFYKDSLDFYKVLTAFERGGLKGLRFNLDAGTLTFPGAIRQDVLSVLRDTGVILKEKKKRLGDDQKKWNGKMAA